MAEMTQRERLLTAIRRDVPDQVPVTWELEHRAALALTGKGGWKGVCDAHREIGSAIFNLQGVGPQMSSTLAPGYADETRYDKHDDGSGETVRTITTPKGSLTERSVWGYIPGDPTLGKRVE
ncbi:MAG: hypothetical protein QF662_07695, partial [Phycisphaerae bacterium]|nr:hypothetical protein [Phycisphaerae bacterium]